jgi:hypothetical protein
VVRLAEDGHVRLRGAQEIEAGADGGAPLFDHVARPAPDALPDDVPVPKQRLGAAEEEGIEIDKQHVKAGLQHPQTEALPLADHGQFCDGDGARRDARQQQPRRVGEAAKDVAELPVHGHHHKIAQAERASRLLMGGGGFLRKGHLPADGGRREVPSQVERQRGWTRSAGQSEF